MRISRRRIASAAVGGYASRQLAAESQVAQKATPLPWGGPEALAGMNLLTLEFEQPEIEHAYMVERFARTGGAVIVISGVNISLHILLTVQVTSCE